MTGLHELYPLLDTDIRRPVENDALDEVGRNVQYQHDGFAIAYVVKCVDVVEKFVVGWDGEDDGTSFDEVSRFIGPVVVVLFFRRIFFGVVDVSVVVDVVAFGAYELCAEISPVFVFVCIVGGGPVCEMNDMALWLGLYCSYSIDDWIGDIVSWYRLWSL